MELTILERIILRNQFSILKETNSKDKELYETYIEVLDRGYELDYPDVLRINEDTLSKDECDEVIDIFQLFNFLNEAYESLEDKLGIDENKIKSIEFDGNKELKQLNYAEFLCKPKRRFAIFAEKYLKKDSSGIFILNSHTPMLSAYRKMVKKWKASDRKKSKENIINILYG